MNFRLFLSKYLGFISRFLPQSPQKMVVGFDIGTSSVKAVEIRYTKDFFEIQNWAVESIEGADTKGALKRIFVRMKIQDQVPVAAVSGKGTLIRYLDMPRMSIEEIRKSFAYEIDKYFPFDPQTIYTDCFIIDPQSKEKKASVLVVAAKKDLIDERIKLFKEADMELTHVTTNSIATANAFGKLIKAEKATGARAILDIGGAVSNLMILDQNNSPCFTRDIFVGSHEMSKQIANTLGIPLADVHNLKRNPGDKQDEILKACESSIGNLTGETRLSLDYFKTEKNTTVTELFLVGGGSLLKGIDGVFEKTLNIPVKIWNPLADVRLGAGVVAAEINPYSAQLGVAIGLALIKI